MRKTWLVRDEHLTFDPIKFKAWTKRGAKRKAKQVARVVRVPIILRQITA
jgi:hypothetical protein